MTDSAFDDFTPSLTYDRSSGSVPVDTSRDATAHADLSGITNKAQRYALILADQRREQGVTVAELREMHGSVHHGRVSAALTNLHRDGRLIALRERRNHCGIYVLPEYVNGREYRVFKPNHKPVEESDIVPVLYDHAADYRGNCRCGWGYFGADHSHRQHVARKIAEALR